MRPFLVLAFALLPAIVQAQSRYGVASPIPPVAPAPYTGQTLDWAGKTQNQQALGTPIGQPQPLSAWALKQAAQASAQPALAALPPPPSTPQPIAGSPTLRAPPPPPAPPPAAIQSAPLAPVTAPAPAVAAPALPPAAPAQTAIQSLAQAAPPPQPAGRPYPGYGVPQIANYPGYGPVTPVQPRAAPRPVAAGAELLLEEVPTVPSLADRDAPIDRPARRDPESSRD